MTHQHAIREHCKGLRVYALSETAKEGEPRYCSGAGDAS